jgi:hypothetical protein
MRLGAQQARRIWKHRSRVGLRKALATQHVEEFLSVPPAHIGVTLALGGAVAEIPPPIDHLLGRATAEP